MTSKEREKNSLIREHNTATRRVRNARLKDPPHDGRLYLRSVVRLRQWPGWVDDIRILKPCPDLLARAKLRHTDCIEHQMWKWIGEGLSQRDSRLVPNGEDRKKKREDIQEWSARYNPLSVETERRETAVCWGSPHHDHPGRKGENEVQVT